MTLGILGNTTKPILREVTGRLLASLKQLSISYVMHDEHARWYNGLQSADPVPADRMCLDTELASRSDIVVALGGDGTMFAAARLIGKESTPILGINLGKLGFLAEVPVEELENALLEIKNGGYTIEERMALEAVSGSDGRSFFALNEIVVDKGSYARAIPLETLVNEDYLVTYAADGIIVATPTGSTAYSLASGGPIVSPQSSVLIINPVSPHTLTARPVIVPDQSIVKITVAASPKPVHITADGQSEGFYEAPVQFTIRRAPYPVRLVKRKRYSYFDLLRTKLLWGRDLRIGPRR